MLLLNNWSHIPLRCRLIAQNTMDVTKQLNTTAPRIDKMETMSGSLFFGGFTGLTFIFTVK